MEGGTRKTTSYPMAEVEQKKKKAFPSVNPELFSKQDKYKRTVEKCPIAYNVEAEGEEERKIINDKRPYILKYLDFPKDLASVHAEEEEKKKRTTEAPPSTKRRRVGAP